MKKKPHGFLISRTKEAYQVASFCQSTYVLWIFINSFVKFDLVPSKIGSPVTSLRNELSLLGVFAHRLPASIVSIGKNQTEIDEVNLVLSKSLPMIFRSAAVSAATAFFRIEVATILVVDGGIIGIFIICSDIPATVRQVLRNVNHSAAWNGAYSELNVCDNVIALLSLELYGSRTAGPAIFWSFY